MKTRFTLFLLFITSLAQAQFRIDSVNPNIVANCSVFPQKYQSDYAFQYDNFGFIQVKDSITGKTIIVKNTGQLDPKSDLYFSQFSNLFSFWQASFEESAPPLLDSLEDGNYVMYYTSFPIADKDTVKFKTDAVRAIIPIKNNTVHGTVYWYYPDGKLMQQSEYVKDQKHGPTFVQHIEQNFYSETEPLHYRSTETNFYFNGKLEGQSTKYTRLAPIIEGKRYMHVEAIEHQPYTNGVPNGRYEVRINDQLIITGNYTNGSVSGAWSIYNWKYKKGVIQLMPVLQLEINDKKTLTTESFFDRKSFNKNPIQGYTHLSYSPDAQRHSYDFIQSIVNNLDYYAYHTDYAYYYLQSFTSISAVPNCLNIPQSKGSEIVQPELQRRYHYALYDSIGNFVELETVMKSCGVVFDYTYYKEFYPNGQTRCSFDFTQPKTLQNATVFYPDGSVMNEVVFDQKDQSFHQYWYDSSGVVLQHSRHSETGEQLELINSADQKTINGIKCSAGTFGWSYYNTADLPVDVDSMYVYSAFFDKQLHPVEIHRFNPAKRQGSIERGYDKNYRSTTNYWFNKEENAIHYSISAKLGALSFEHAFALPIDSLEYLIVSYDTVTWQFLNAASIYSLYQGKNPVILENGKPCSKSIRLIYDNSKKLKVTAKRDEIVITSPYNASNVLDYFLRAIYYDIPEPEYNLNILTDIATDERTQQLAVKSVVVSLKDGKFDGTIERTSACGFPLEQIDWKQRTETRYNNYPYQNDGAIADDTHNYIDSLYSFLSERVVSDEEGKSILSLYMNALGDTTLYDVIDPSTGDHFHMEISDYSDRIVFRETDTILEKYSATRYNKEHPYFVYNRKKNTCQTYYEDGKLEGDYRISRGLVDQITLYDTLFQVTSVAQLRNGYLDNERQYVNGFLTNTLTYFPEDSIKPDLGEIPSRFDDLLFDWPEEFNGFHLFGSSRTQGKENNRCTVKKWSNDVVVEEGIMDYYQKTGIWTYTYPGTNRYTITYKDTLLKEIADAKTIECSLWKTEKGNLHAAVLADLVRYDNANNPIAIGRLYEFEKEYSCLQQNYSERYMIEYTAYNGKPVAGTTYTVVNYYPNGNKMNEGTIVDGKAEGLWRWYFSDGSLYEVGKYKNGLREGRWLNGDLSKVHFTGEMCLDPDSADYKAILQRIYVTVFYYEKGVKKNWEHHTLSTE